jgi:hypothetical protein
MRSSLSIIDISSVVIKSPVNSNLALISRELIGNGSPDGPYCLELLKNKKADQTCANNSGAGGPIKSFGVCPVCLSTCSKCSLKVIPSFSRLLILKENSANSSICSIRLS